MTTRNSIGIGVFVILIIGIAIAIMSSGPEEDAQPGQLIVAATIFPIYDIAQNVAGDTARVELLLPPGASPHLFEFSPRQLRELQGTRAIFAVGHGLDDWALIAANALNAAEVTFVDSNIPLRRIAQDEQADRGENRNVSSDSFDPHYWLDFDNAATIADNIASELAQLDPVNAASYQADAARYKQQLADKQVELQAKVASLRGTKIVTLHDAWYYFANFFGLNIIGVFEPSAGEEPTPRFLSKLQTNIDQQNISIIFSEPQLVTSSLANFARDNNLGIAKIDPLGGSEERDTYLKLMEFNVDAVLAALQNR